MIVMFFLQHNAIKTMPVETDRNDARAIAQLVAPTFQAPKKDFLMLSTTTFGFSTIKKCPPSTTYSIV